VPLHLKNEPVGSEPDDECPAAEELAAFLDGALDPEGREAVISHLLRCPECKDVVGSVAERRDHVGTLRGPSFPPRWMALAATILLAVSVATVGGVRWLSRRPADATIADLVQATGPQRWIEPRLSGGFAWAPIDDARGESTGAGSPVQAMLDPRRLEIAGVAARIRGAKAQEDPRGDAHTLGLAYLLLGSVEEAVARLDTAAADAPEDPAVLSDLAAARIESGRTRDGARDLVRALDLTERALDIAPRFVEARFNKALALETLGLREAASDAWDDYLRWDSTSSWSNEARARAARLRAVAKPEPWEASAKAFASACAGNDAPRLDTIVRQHPQQALEALMSELGRWAHLSLAGDPGAGAALDAVGHGAAVMTRITGDPIVENAVAEIRSAAVDGQRTRRLAEAHAKLFEGLGAHDAMGADDATRLLADASDRFAKLASPYGDVAELYRLSSAYYINPLGAYRTQLDALIRKYPVGRKSVVGARARWLQGLALAVSGRPFPAIASLSASGDGLSAMGFSADAAFVRSIEATTWFTLGQLDRAWKIHREVFRRLDAVTDARRAQALIGSTAKEAELEGERSAALSLGRAALAMSRHHDSAFDRCDGLVWFASAAARAGKVAAVRDAVREARTLLTGVADAGMQARLDAELSLVESRLNLEANPAGAVVSADRAIAWLESADRQFKLAEAYELRAEAKEHAGDLDGALKDYTTALEGVERQRDRLDDRELRTSFADLAWELARDIVRFEVDRGDPVRALAMADRIRATSVAPPETLAPEAARDPVNTLLRQLGPDQAVVFYAVLEHRTIAWVLRKDEVRSTVIPIEETAIERLVETFRREMADRSTRGDTGTGQRLFKELVEPLRDQLQGAQRIVIVPDGRLHSIPWNALRARGEHRWIEDVAVAVAPSLRCLIGRRDGRIDPAELRVVAVGNPAFDPDAYPGLPALPGAAQEARAVGDLYRRATVLTGAEATPERVLDESSRADILHVAAHAVSGGVDPERSTIVLAAGGTMAPQGGVTPRDLRGRDMSNLRMVVLAACRSGDGPLSRIEGPLSLARPLLENGVHNVVVSLWDLPDVAGGPVMAALHGAIREGADPIEALRRAQLECWAATDSDPVACGGLQLIVNEPMGE